LVEDLFGEGADQGFAPELAVMVGFGAADDVIDMEGAFGSCKYIINYSHIRLSFFAGRRRGSVLGAAQGAQGAQVSESSIF
jgi:hypothetical protein